MSLSQIKNLHNLFIASPPFNVRTFESVRRRFIMQTSVHVKPIDVVPLCERLDLMQSPVSQSHDSGDLSLLREELDECRVDVLEEPKSLFKFTREAVSPIDKLPMGGSRILNSGFFEGSPIHENTNTSFNNFLKKGSSSQVEVIPDVGPHKSINGSSLEISLNGDKSTPERKQSSVRRNLFFSTKVNGDKSNMHSNLSIEDKISDQISSDFPPPNARSAHKKKFQNNAHHIGNNNLAPQDITELLEPKKIVSVNTNMIDNENDSDSDDYFKHEDGENGAEFIDSSRKLNLIFEPEVIKDTSLSLNIYNCHSNQDINIKAIPYQHRKASEAAKPTLPNIFSGIEKIISPVQNLAPTEISDSDQKVSDSSDFLKLNRFPKIKLRLKANNNINLNMESQNSERQISPQSSRRRINIMRSSTLKRIGFDNTHSRRELSRKDSCEPMNSNDMSRDFDNIYYGDNKFVNPKNTITNRLRKTSTAGYDGPQSDDNKLFLNLPDLKGLAVSSSKKDVFTSSQLFDISSLNQLKKSDEQSMFSSNNQDTLVKNNNQVGSKFVCIQARNLFKDPYNEECENASNFDNCSKDRIFAQELASERAKVRNFSSKDLFFGNGNKTATINRQKRFKTASQAVINFNMNSGLNNIDIDEEAHEEMSRKSSPVKLQGKTNKNKHRFDFAPKSMKKCLLSDVQSSMSRSERMSLFNENYEILENLGSGHFGTVYKCKNRFDGLIYAIKVLNTATKTAINEAQALASLNVMYESTHIVRYFSSWKEENTVYIVMEMCSKNLEQWGQQTPKIDEKMIRKIIKHLCKALSKLHKDKMVHLDIKPENILISNSGKYKLSDLGLVKVLRNKEDVRTLTEGDARYMAKELLHDYSFEDVNSNKADLTKADIFSLGITMYELMTRNVINLPKNGPLWHQLRDNNIPMLDKLGSYSNSLKRLISAMMDADPTKRPSAKEIINTHLLYSKHNKIMLLKEQIKLLKDEVKKSSLTIEKNKAEAHDY